MSPTGPRDTTRPWHRDGNDGATRGEGDGGEQDEATEADGAAFAKRRSQLSEAQPASGGVVIGFNNERQLAWRALLGARRLRK